MRTLSFRPMVAALPVLLLWIVSCAPEKAATSPPPRPVEQSAFAGSAACQPCHAAESESHARTFHATTLREATVADLGTLAPAPGPIPDGTITIDNGRLGVKSWTGELPLQFVLGSGKSGLTFLAVGYDSSTEVRQSYFPARRTWHATPGQDATATEFGRTHPEALTRKCLGCHAVALPKASLLPERRFFGVGCESCHGPGVAHIAAVQAGGTRAGLAITSLRGATGTQLNDLCGKCHRTGADMVGANASARAMTNRFQPYGLAQSRCFKESDNKLTCVTCHNPHENAGKDPKPYEKACLTCHGGAGTPHKAKTCPVNPTQKCVSCHMPTRPVFQNSTIPIRMADHFIRVVRR